MKNMSLVQMNLYFLTSLLVHSTLTGTESNILVVILKFMEMFL